MEVNNGCARGGRGKELKMIGESGGSTPYIFALGKEIISRHQQPVQYKRYSNSFYSFLSLLSIMS